MGREAPEGGERARPGVDQAAIGRGGRPRKRVGRVSGGWDAVTQLPGDGPATGRQPGDAAIPVGTIEPLPRVQDRTAIGEPSRCEILARIVGEPKRRAGAEGSGRRVQAGVERAGVLARGENGDEQQAVARRHEDGRNVFRPRWSATDRFASYPSPAAAFRRHNRTPWRLSFKPPSPLSPEGYADACPPAPRRVAAADGSCASSAFGARAAEHG